MHGWVPRRTLAPMSCFCGLCTSRQPASHETSADTFRRHRNRGATTSRSTCRIPPPPPPPRHHHHHHQHHHHPPPPPVPRAPPPVPLLLPNASDASAARSDGWSRIGGGRAARKALRYARSSARVRVDAVCSTMHAELCSSCQCEGDDGAWRCCDGYLLVMARSAQLSGSPPPPPSRPPPALLSACEKTPRCCCRCLWERRRRRRGREEGRGQLGAKAGHARPCVEVEEDRDAERRGSSAHVLNAWHCISAAVEE